MIALTGIETAETISRSCGYVIHSRKGSVFRGPYESLRLAGTVPS